MELLVDQPNNKFMCHVSMVLMPENVVAQYHQKEKGDWILFFKRYLLKALHRNCQTITIFDYTETSDLDSFQYQHLQFVFLV
jgi:hypothetical protein